MTILPKANGAPLVVQHPNDESKLILVGSLGRLRAVMPDIQSRCSQEISAHIMDQADYQRLLQSPDVRVEGSIKEPDPPMPVPEPVPVPDVVLERLASLEKTLLEAIRMRERDIQQPEGKGVEADADAEAEGEEEEEEEEEVDAFSQERSPVINL